jgi:hypothetical protein
MHDERGMSGGRLWCTWRRDVGYLGIVQDALTVAFSCPHSAFEAIYGGSDGSEETCGSKEVDPRR